MGDPLPGANALLGALSFETRRGGRTVLRGVSLELRAGEVVWLRGPSGSGKSTLLRALARLVPWSGELSLRGLSAAGARPRQWRSRVALLASPPVPVGETLGEDLLAPWELRVRRDLPAPTPEVLARELEGVGLGELALSRPTRELSLGQLARVAFLRTVLAEPEVLLLDEPSANLDAASSQAVAARTFRFAAAGRAVLAAGHSAPWEGVHRRLRIEGEGLAEEVP